MTVDPQPIELEVKLSDSMGQTQWWGVAHLVVGSDNESESGWIVEFPPGLTFRPSKLEINVRQKRKST